MRSLAVPSFIAGVLFGMWPIVMNKSGLNGKASAVILEAICFALAIPFAFQTMNARGFAGGNIRMAIASSLICGIGVLIYTNVLAKATTAEISTLMVVNLVTQIAASAAYQAIATGKVSPAKGLGFVAATAAAVLLLK